MEKPSDKNNKEEKKSFLNRINVSNLNNMIGTGEKIMRILYIVLIILLVYIGVLVLKEFKIFPFILKTLSIISPLFIGFVIAWILNPLVNKLTKWKVNRTLAVIIVFALLIGVLYLFTLAILPALANQIKDIVATIPSILADLKSWVENIFDKLSDLSLENLDNVKIQFFESIEKVANGVQTNLPTKTINFISSMISGIGVILLSFVVGFYMLFNFNNVSKGFLNLLPLRYRDEASDLLGKISSTVREYVNGTLLLSLILTVISFIGFSIIGLKAALLIAVVCGVTNLIPYIGPYMGAAVAGAIGFTQSNVVGILTLVFILITQTLEGNFLTPLFMSKKMHLHPVTILIALLIFGYFFGIIGMIIATPVVALLKIIFIFFNEKYKFLNFSK